jgi:Leucine-rich repeat (LRR) protein
VFLAYLLATIDTNGDGKISVEEAALVEEMSLENEGGNKDGSNKNAGVKSLAGIEYFTNLRRLNVGKNSLEKLDLSKNTRLTYLNCSDNSLKSLSLPVGSLLETLNCNNNGLTSLNVSVLPRLKYLYCTNNELKTLDVKANVSLVEFSCGGNSLTALDVSGCSALTDLNCGVSDRKAPGDTRTDIVSLTLPSPSVLVRLDCGGNQLTGLDLSGQDKLSLLRVNVNPITALNVSPCTSLRTLECVDCSLAELDITSNERLRLLFCNGNPDGMKIFVKAGFDPSKFLSWVIGSATVVEKAGL